jgi:hypothetical protein
VFYIKGVFCVSTAFSQPGLALGMGENGRVARLFFFRQVNAQTTLNAPFPTFPTFSTSRPSQHRRGLSTKIQAASFFQLASNLLASGLAFDKRLIKRIRLDKGEHAASRFALVAQRDGKTICRTTLLQR